MSFLNRSRRAGSKLFSKNKKRLCYEHKKVWSWCGDGVSPHKFRTQGRPSAFCPRPPMVAWAEAQPFLYIGGRTDSFKFGCPLKSTQRRTRTPQRQRFGRYLAKLRKLREEKLRNEFMMYELHDFCPRPPIVAWAEPQPLNALIGN